MSTKPQVLFVGDLNRSLPEFEQFEKKFECIFYVLTSKEQLIEDLKTKFKNIQGVYGAWSSFETLGGFRDQILDNAPSSLKVVSVCSVGYDGFDKEKMRKKGILLTNVPADGAADPVSDLVLFNALTSFRNFHLAFPSSDLPNNSLKLRSIQASNKFDLETGKAGHGNDEGFAFGNYIAGRPNISPNGHNVVIVGFGKIGQKIGKKLAQIGMNIHYVKRNKLSEKEENSLDFKVTYHKSIEDAIGYTELVVIACPGTPETRHLINESYINSVKAPFRVINIGRGYVIDEEALLRGLKSGKILFAALDVYENEPFFSRELIDRQDVVLTPHIGSSTVQNFDYTSQVAMKNIENVLLEGGSGLTTVN